MKAATLQRALPVVAGMIADRTGIEVKTAGGACTDGKVIYLPPLPLNLKEEDFVRAIGYIYHEAGHILDTDFSVPLGTGLQRAIMNSLEDIRIEKVRMARSPGARRYLDRLVEILTNLGLDGGSEGFWPVPADDSVPAHQVFQAFLLYKLRHDVLGQVGIKPLLDSAETAMARFPQGMRTRLEALMFEVEQCENTADVEQLTNEIIRMIEEEQEKQEQQQQQQQNQSSDSSDDEEAQSGGSTASDEGSTDDSGQDGAVDEQGDQSQSDQQQNQNGNANDQQSSAECEQEQDGTASDQSGKGAGGSGILKELLSMTDDQVMATLDEMLEQSLNGASTTSSRSGRIVSAANILPLRLPKKQADTTRIKSAINVIRVRTKAWMSCVTESDTQLVHAGKELDYSRLFQARFGGPIFSREDEGIDLNADISILIDRSGSMQSQIQLAGESALAALLAYDIQGINTQVAAFPVSGWVNGNLDSDGVGVIKGWNESPRLLGGRIQSLTTDGSTPMAEAILWSTCDLLKRENARRIVLVVTDGDPDDPSATREVIDMARASGVQVLGLGIESDTKAVFGDKYAAKIDDIKELSGSMVKLIKQALSQ